MRGKTFQHKMVKIPRENCGHVTPPNDHHCISCFPHYRDEASSVYTKALNCHARPYLFSGRMWRGLGFSGPRGALLSIEATSSLGEARLDCDRMWRRMGLRTRVGGVSIPACRDELYSCDIYVRVTVWTYIHTCTLSIYTQHTVHVHNPMNLMHLYTQ